MSDGLFWTIVVVGLVVAGEPARAALREWHARRRTIKHGRTLTAKYGIPWR
jgi:hypothetical protein